MKYLTACLFSGVCLSVCVSAQPAPAAATPPPAPAARPATPGTDNGPLSRLSRQMDTDGNQMVDEKEFAAGFAKLEKAAAKAHADLLTWLDKDKNGSLSPEELRPFEAALALLPFIRNVDQNGDIALQDPELEAAFTRLAEFCQRDSEQTLEQFDLDRDGKLNAEELQLLRQSQQRAVVRSPRAGAAPTAAAPRDGLVSGGGKP
jgi:Ca2+-binding EF-hand superfamily protein